MCGRKERNKVSAQQAVAKQLIRVPVVEDHHVVRLGLVSLLNLMGGVEVVGEAADGVEAIAQVQAGYHSDRPANAPLGRGRCDPADKEGDAGSSVHCANYL